MACGHPARIDHMLFRGGGTTFRAVVAVRERRYITPSRILFESPTPPA